MIERLSAIEMAAKNELIEKEYYEKLLKTTTTPLGKSIFERLAYEEKIHYEGLKELYEEVQRDGKLPDPLPSIFKKTNIQEILETLMLNTAEIPTISKDDLENINRSMVLEGKVVIFYERLLDKTSDPGIRSLFELFVNVERKHSQFLKDIKEFLVKAMFVE